MEKQPRYPKWERPHEMPDKYIQARQRILTEVGQNREGLNIDRCYDFIRSLGLGTTDCIVVTRGSEDYLKLINIKAEAAGFVGDIPNNWGGLYDNNLNLIFVFRDEPDQDEVSQTMRSESTLVHELVHGSSKYKEFHGLEVQPINQRTGFAIKRSSVKVLEGSNDGNDVLRMHVNVEDLGGSFLEEGIAEMLAIEYSEANLPDSEKVRRLNALDLDENIETGSDQYRGKLATINLLDSDSGAKYKLSLPIKYSFFTKGEFSYCNPFRFFQAYALELLCDRLPELRQSLLDSRHDVNALRKVIKLLNSLDSNLYVDLRNLSEDIGGSAEGFVRVAKIIGGVLVEVK